MTEPSPCREGDRVRETQVRDEERLFLSLFPSGSQSSLTALRCSHTNVDPSKCGILLGIYWQSAGGASKLK